MILNIMLMLPLTIMLVVAIAYLIIVAIRDKDYYGLYLLGAIFSVCMFVAGMKRMEKVYKEPVKNHQVERINNE